MPIFSKRLQFLKAYILQFLILSFFVRLALYVWSFSAIDFSIFHLLRIIFTGWFFDLGVVLFFAIIYVLHLLLTPNKWVGKSWDKAFTYGFYFLTTLIITFSFFAEFNFWEEFKNRFNFIAVDYLIYTYEVVQNINESYPIPLLLAGVVIFVYLQYFVLKKAGVFAATFNAKINIQQKFLLIVLLIIPFLYGFFIENTHAEWSKNRYENELSKSGIYSFFAAFRNNELSYPDFYKTQDLDLSFKLLKNNLKTNQDTLFSTDKYNISRRIKSYKPEAKPNVIFICLESFSADFMEHFGNKSQITPFVDSLMQQSVYFENLYATGTRTIRGMEAIVLSVPPSPGRSIIKRKDNTNMKNIGDVFKDKGYSRSFFYGGDGYFDNMNNFFGGNGFDIVDRGRGYLFGDSFTAKRTNIEDDEVQFENAWGICDEDIYNKVIQEADKSYAEGKPFFNFIMSTSNHRPYTYPDDKIDIPSGSGRHGAVKYTDFAIKELLSKIKNKAWYKNTVIAIMADHCASSAGKWELNVGKYHIPALFYNLPNTTPQKIDRQASQVDFFPTLFGYLGWEYTSDFYGQDINTISDEQERAFIGNYRKLGLLRKEKLGVLGDGKKAHFYLYDKEKNSLQPEAEDKERLQDIVSYYQTNDYRYHKGLMQHKKE